MLIGVGVAERPGSVFRKLVCKRAVLAGWVSGAGGGRFYDPAQIRAMLPFWDSQAKRAECQQHVSLCCGQTQFTHFRTAVGPDAETPPEMLLVRCPGMSCASYSSFL